MSTATIPKTNETPAREFEEIFREHCQFVYRTAYSVTGSRPDAEDVLQNIFLKLLQREFPPDLKKTPRAYLYRAAVNLSLNSVRSRKHRQTTHDIDSLEAPAPVGEGSAAEELQQDLVGAISQLRPQAVEILILRYTHGYSDAQIATMLGKSRGTIAVTLYRARARLKKIMGEKRAGETYEVQ
jgi:RNA polymerase sigma-70 factor (ECF subfamily)